MSKGSTPRKFNKQRFDEEFDRIFGKVAPIKKVNRKEAEKIWTDSK